MELKDLKPALKLVGYDLPPFQIRELEIELKKSNANRDGKMSLEEFQNVIFFRLTTFASSRGKLETNPRLETFFVSSKIMAICFAIIILSPVS